VGTACAACHTTTAWKPGSIASITHTFPVTHQGSNSVCASCHTATWDTYSCAKCHSNTSMTSRHKSVSGFTLTTCAKCHPTGRGG
jgi:hypothetical protein